MRQPIGRLSKHIVIYGAGDIAVAAASLLLLPIYLKHLSQEDYGALAMLIGVEAVSKILFRFGLDGAFMRFYMVDEDDEARARLTSTLFAFLFVASGLIFALGLAGSGALAHHLFPEYPGRYVTPLRLVLINSYLLTFTFVPFHVMRMRQEAATYAAINFGKSLATLLLRLGLVVVAGWGLVGLPTADLVVTLALVPVLWRWTAPLVRPAFSRPLLAACLRFGLPRLPHGLAQQVLDAGNKYLLNRFVPLSSLGVYQISTSLGQSLKFFLSAFETSWAPFYYETGREPTAKVTFAKITTYGVATLALLVAGLAAVTPDLIRLMTVTAPWQPQAYAEAAVVIPLIALGIAWQGVYLLTSIGLNLTAQTAYYPLATFAAAAMGLASGAILMPAYGVVGAGVAFLLSYVTLALVAGAFAQRCYPIGYETARLARVVLAAGLAFLAGWAWPAMAPLLGLLVRGTTTVAAFGLLLLVMGFFRPTERLFLRDFIRYLARGTRVRSA